MVIETKVITSTLAAEAVSIGIAALNGVEAHHELLGSLGPTWQAIILAVVPGALTFLSGWAAKHTPRPATPPPVPPVTVTPAA